MNSNNLQFNNTSPMPLKHGGDLTAAEKVFGIPKDQWIDLSTGISPWSWPVPPVPEAVWQSLPDAGDGLEQVAAQYYGCDESVILPVSGSQQAIEQIPSLIQRGRVAIPVRGYEEHRLAWAKAGHEIAYYQSTVQLQQWVASGQVNHGVVINPNNPTGEMIGKQELLSLNQQLQQKGGWLLVDEAFMDTVNIDGVRENSLVPDVHASGLVVLRSIGKFFGLAGLRLGFVIGPPSLLQQLAADFPPWHLSHPARWVGKQALADVPWHGLQRQRLGLVSKQWLQQLGQILQQGFPDLELSSTSLFVSGRGCGDLCEAIYQGLAQRGILVRLFETIGEQGMIRFGLPREDKLSQVLEILDQVVQEQLCTVA